MFRYLFEIFSSVYLYLKHTQQAFVLRIVHNFLRRMSVIVEVYPSGVSDLLSNSQPACCQFWSMNQFVPNQNIYEADLTVNEMC